MMTSYFTFGQSHAHRVNNLTLDKDIVLKITADCPRSRMVDLFGSVWAFEYKDEPPDMKYFPRGIYEMDTPEPPK